MIVSAREQFELAAPADEAALAFLRNPVQALSKVRFLREVQVSGQTISGVLAVQLPLLGEVTLPFVSVLEDTPTGARLLPQAIEQERAWLEVVGEGKLLTGQLGYVFEFRAHLDTPAADKWGGAAFEKMVQAAASRTMSRVAQDLPRALAAALADAERQI